MRRDDRVATESDLQSVLDILGAANDAKLRYLFAHEGEFAGQVGFEVKNEWSVAYFMLPISQIEASDADTLKALLENKCEEAIAMTHENYQFQKTMLKYFGRTF
jgi:hypothetical protein